MQMFGTHDDATVKQLERCLTPGSIGALMADNHKGYSMPIGGVVAYQDAVSPSGVGYDIACGNCAIKLDLKVHEVPRVDWPVFADMIQQELSFGIGRKNNTPVEHAVLEEIATHPLGVVRALAQKAAAQLGTVGSGNHYVDVFEGFDGHVWIGVHFGSRGFGHSLASGFMNVAKGLPFGERAHEGEMDAPPLLLTLGTPAADDYIAAMQVAGRYAYAGRAWVCDKVRALFGNPTTLDVVHNHHNFAWPEHHFGRDYWVVRKGATPAFAGQRGFVGGSMGDASVILEGVESAQSAAALYSTVHGAGRVMSRTQAAGKQKWVRGEDGKKRPQRVSAGLVDFAEVQRMMLDKGIELRGAGADEAPQVYRKLMDVLAAQGDTIKLLNVLYPRIVVMAGGDEHDPYKEG